ncbi:MAG: HAMP domain-containing sensor histidine kinase [Actinomycetota bacterium]|nr:HAMP domain-containing sensor histidine kinase [Actinomycetota bacterium]
MRRRITVAMVVMVLVTLVLSGLVSLFLAQQSLLTSTRRELLHEATGLAAAVPQEARTNSATDKDPAATLRTLLAALRPSLRLDGSAVIGVLPGGQLVNLTPFNRHPALPAGLPAAALPGRRLYQLQPVTGRTGGLVFAAVPYQASIRIAGRDRSVVQVVVLTRRPPTSLQTAGPWFGLSALAILIVSGVVAWRLGRRFTAPVRAAEVVASRVAAGDLDARVPEPAGTDPELAALAAAINSMTEGLSRAQAAERHFLQSVSHDLRTPLTSIRGFAEAIEDGATADAVAAAGVIASEARRLERLVGDLLALATLEARRFTLQPQVVDLVAQTAEAAAGFGPSAADLGLQVTCVTAPPGRRLYATADPDRLAQILANLIENALRYARAGVWVGAAPGPDGGPTGTGPLVWVSDDGPGITAFDLPRVFDRLYGARRQPDGSRPGRPIGSGLGLTIVAELVTAMGGRVWAESPLTGEGGTRMVVELPPAPGGESGGAPRPASA